MNSFCHRQDGNRRHSVLGCGLEGTQKRDQTADEKSHFSPFQRVQDQLAILPTPFALNFNSLNLRVKPDPAPLTSHPDFGLKQINMHAPVEIALHLGAPFTDEDQITWSLRGDTQTLVDHQIMLRRPKQYRQLISKCLADHQGREASIETQDQLLTSIIRKQQVKRLILSNSKFLGSPSWMLSGGAFYQKAGANVAALRGLFSQHPSSLFLALRNPAPLISAAFAAQNSRSFAEFKGDTRFQDIRWSRVVAEIQAANPDCPLTVWCHEDTPIIWRKVLQHVTGLDADTKFAGELNILKKIISPDGTVRLEKYLESHPQLTLLQREQVFAIFLEKFVVEDEVEEVIDLPGWTDHIVTDMTQIYEQDIQRIMNMPGVTFIAPQSLPDPGPVAAD